MYIIHQERVKANVTMHDQGDTQDSVQDGVDRTTGDERGASHGKEGSGEEPLECPMVRSVALVRWRESRRIVHGSFVNRTTRNILELSFLLGGGCRARLSLTKPYGTGQSGLPREMPW